ncbi:MULTISPECIES: hypothetical protein [unclassified Nostoc]|nr:hypothetical protein [Nostoc sp. ChiQUE02]
MVASNLSVKLISEFVVYLFYICFAIARTHHHKKVLRIFAR